MKNFNRLSFFFLLTTISVFAQSQEKMSYQAVIRDVTNTLLTNQSVGMQISIIQTSITGDVLYTETHTVATNINGLVSLEIGSGISSDTFSNIDWSSGPYFIKTETDPTGGSNYTIIGTSQLMSVPFALHAKVAESVSSPVYSIGHSPELGGYVFMVSADGKHGLVCETIDQGVSSWYNAQNVISNPSNHSANGQNFTDWRVPTRYELAQMYSIKTGIEAFGESFGARTYWTSNQSVYSVNGLSEETAWRQNFGTGLQYDNNNISLDGVLFVRSVREF
tara:strand:+ start:2190 stop:3023 length:834 start_codon:yes stop_codon:yes gene_type:complete